MNCIKSILLIITVTLLPLNIRAAETEEAIDIPEIVLEHLSDAYEWHIASDVSIPLPIILRSSATGKWTFCTEKSLPQNYFFNHEKHGKIYEGCLPNMDRGDHSHCCFPELCKMV